MLRRHRYSPVTGGLAVLAVISLAAAGCGQAVSGDDEETAGQPSGFPYTDKDNCDVTTTYQQPPERAVTLTSNATELMLELGLEDRMVGTGYLKDRDIGKRYQDAYDKVPVLASGMPSLESVVDTDPDFVYAGYPDGFSKSHGHSRERFEDLSINTHLNPESCGEQPPTFKTLLDEIKTVGSIFDVPKRADKSVQRLRGTLDDVQEHLDDADPVNVFVYNSGESSPRTAGGQALLSEIIKQAGGKNIFADEDDRWFDTSWEQVADREPDVILIYDYQDPSVGEKKATLRDTSAISSVPAIRDDRFETIPLSVAQPGPRSVDAVRSLAKELHPDRFGN